MSLWGKKYKHVRKIRNKALLSEFRRSTRLFVMHRLSCNRFSIHLYGTQNGSGYILESELGFTTQLPAGSSAPAISNATANSLFLPSSCPIPQKTVDFMLFVSVPVQMQLLSTAVQRKVLHSRDAFCKEGLDFTASPLLQLFHSVTSCKKE